MLVTRTDLESVKVLRNGTLEVQFAKEVVDDATGTVVSTGWHRTTIEPGRDLDQLLTANNASLQALGYPNVPPAVRTRIAAIVAAAHTPAVIAAFRASLPPER